MQTFTGLEYLKIDLANHYGYDKLVYEERIKWADLCIEQGLLDDQTHYESLRSQADKPALFTAARMAIIDALNGDPSGHMVGFDACSSGIQIMSVLMNCETGCSNTGLIHENVRSDVYSTGTTEMNKILAKQNLQVNIGRKAVKSAIMTHFYGSTKLPENLFGEDTPELQAFYDALSHIAPGATIAMQHLLGAWQPYALTHEWYLPDGHYSYVPVMEDVQFKVEVQELDKTCFDFRTSENIGTKKGLSIAANVIHSIDGMIVREMNRRCNHIGIDALEDLEKTLSTWLVLKGETKADYTKFISIVEADRLISGQTGLADYTTGELKALLEVIQLTKQYKAFPIICVHDEFKSHPNHMNQLRKHYGRILAQLAMSNTLEDILSQIHGCHYRLPKMGNIAKKIMNNNYGLS